jgi:DNA-directed RNA polymerase specialized sigma24 family protein
VRLAQRVRAGDERALDELFARYYERIYRIVRIRLGARVRSVLDARKLEAETRADASAALRGMVPNDHAGLIQWLAGIAERRLLAGQPSPTKLAPGMLTESSVGGAATQVPASYVGNPELREIYDACVESLAGRRREIVLLREYARCSWDQIAAEMHFESTAIARDEYRRAQLEIAAALRRRLRG